MNTGRGLLEAGTHALWSGRSKQQQQQVGYGLTLLSYRVLSPTTHNGNVCMEWVALSGFTFLLCERRACGLSWVGLLPPGSTHIFSPGSAFSLVIPTVYRWGTAEDSGNIAAMCLALGLCTHSLTTHFTDGHLP